jgi:3-deoxy-manno-octulosonate cytidylyltransferase (CMP-KDO synthetase)
MILSSFSTKSKSKSDVIGVIPVRFESVRLHGKALLEISGKPMIYWVYKNASRCTYFDKLLVASDSKRILGYCRAEGIPAIETGEHPSGSDRLFEVVTRTEGDIYVNVQGDEPTVHPDHIELLLRPFQDVHTMVSTLKVAISHETALNPNVVKVVTSQDDFALYFSRYPIPFDRSSDQSGQYYKHLGMYAYRREALERFHSLSPTPLEKTERLEQLRFLENGISIRVLETDRDTIGVDTQEDLEAVRNLFENRR